MSSTCLEDNISDTCVRVFVPERHGDSLHIISEYVKFRHNSCVYVRYKHAFDVCMQLHLTRCLSLHGSSPIPLSISHHRLATCWLHGDDDGGAQDNDGDDDDDYVVDGSDCGGGYGDQLNQCPNIELHSVIFVVIALSSRRKRGRRSSVVM